jgi:hypothetical protein
MTNPVVGSTFPMYNNNNPLQSNAPLLSMQPTVSNMASLPSVGMVTNPYSLLGGANPMRPLIPGAVDSSLANVRAPGAASYVPLGAAPNSYLSTNASLHAQGSTGAAPGYPTEANFTSILSASGTSITIPTPVQVDTGKAGKVKAPKQPKPPSEKKQAKRPISKGSDLAVQAAAAAAAAGQCGTTTGAPTADKVTNSNKARRGPSALRVWRIKEEFLPLAAELCAAPLLGSASAAARTTVAAQPSAVATSTGAGTNASAVESKLGTNSIPAANSSNSGGAAAASSSNSSASGANLALQLLVQQEIVRTAALADYTHQSALEVEERLLRRLAGQCNIALKATRYRVGTAYLSTDPDVMTQVIGSRFVRNSAQLPAYYNKSSGRFNGTSDTNSEDYLRDAGSYSTEPNYALYEDGASITSAYLLDKVRRTKRQRGDCLYGSITLPYSSAASASVSAARNAAAAAVGVYSAAHVHALSAVCNKATEYIWGSGHGGNGTGSPRSHTKAIKRPPPSATKAAHNEPITMAQYAYHLHMGIISSGAAPVVLSSCSNGSSISAHTLRRYAQPLNLTGGNLPMLDPNKSATIFAAATGGAHSTTSSGRTNFTVSNNGSEVLRIPDLSLCTREIAWSEIAQEFSLLPAPVDEPGHIAVPAPHPPSAKAADVAADVAAPNKKRKYLQNQVKAPVVPYNATLEDATQKLASLEVLAPQYKEVVPVCQLVRQAQAQQEVCSVHANAVRFILWPCFSAACENFCSFRSQWDQQRLRSLQCFFFCSLGWRRCCCS